ncbi:5-hydroxyisourate hydrolase [Oratosquilla oratoria]|uniref:5-hydroxyisourate hydrolase n=1 Tax=Oratosquilla oratoria TaxID=337810 RepID=UPI003F768244
MSSQRLEVLQSHLGRIKKTGTPVLSATSSGTMTGNPITSHVLDTATGKPAANLGLSLHKQSDSLSWTLVSSKVTNSDGRASNFLSQEEFTQGVYKMRFETGDYFKQLNTKGFYPYVEIVFEIEAPEEHYHIPLLLSPYGYSSYRGS